MGKISGFHEGNQILGSRYNGDASKWPRPSYDSSQLSSSAVAAQLPTTPSSLGIWPAVNVNKSYPPAMNPIPPLHRQNKFDMFSTNHGQQKPLYVAAQHQVDAFGMKDMHSMRTNQQSPLNQPDQALLTSLPHIMQTQVPQDLRFPTTTAPLHSNLLAQPSNHLYNLQGSTAGSAVLPTVTPVSQLPLQVPNIPGSSVLVQGGVLPPLPPGSSHSLPLSQNSTASSQAPGAAFSGLISSLMAQGLISLEKQTSPQV